MVCKWGQFLQSSVIEPIQIKQAWRSQVGKRLPEGANLRWSINNMGVSINGGIQKRLVCHGKSWKKPIQLDDLGVPL